MSIDPTRPRGVERKPKRPSAANQARIAELEAQVAELIATIEASNG